MHRRCGFRAGKSEAGQFADAAAPAIAAGQPAAVDTLRSSRRLPRHVHAIVILHDAGDVTFAAHVDAEGAHALTQHRFQVLLGDHAVAPPGLLLRIFTDQRQAGEMAAEIGWFPEMLREGLHQIGIAFFGGVERRAHAAPLQRFGAQRPDRQCLDRGIDRGAAFQHQHAGAAKRQLDRQQQAHWPGASDDNIDIAIHGFDLNVY